MNPWSTHDQQPCWLVSTTGQFYTVNNTWTPDPKRARIAERWYMEKLAMTLTIPTVFIRAA